MWTKWTKWTKRTESFPDPSSPLPLFLLASPRPRIPASFRPLPQSVIALPSHSSDAQSAASSMVSNSISLAGDR